MRLRSVLLRAVLLVAAAGCTGPRGAIDRERLVRRHHPVLERADPLAPLSVGNGRFAFTADITGLQTYPDRYRDGIPLATQSEWGWHTVPAPRPVALADAVQRFDAGGRRVPYASLQDSPAGGWLRANPHRLNLGRVGLALEDAEGRDLPLERITRIRQEADLWNGILHSSFEAAGVPVAVETACHPGIDQVSARVRSGLVGSGRIAVRFDFPYGSTEWGKDPSDWRKPERHFTRIVARRDRSVALARTLDGDSYHVFIHWSGDARFVQHGPHSFGLEPAGRGSFAFSVRFSAKADPGVAPPAQATFEAARDHWHRFWLSGGAVDLSQSSDPRARELERRIVLSRYLTAIQCRQSIPPAETGLTCNSWFGKFHLEMHWWHGVHFALWGDPEALGRTLPWYRSILPEARRTAAAQGYAGARWPKMTSPDGRESPSSVGVFLVWQQPHPVYYAELLYRLDPKQETLARYRDLVFATADFMADFARCDDSACVLGPPLIPAQEIHPPEETLDPAFELAYWRFGLETAQTWRGRLGLGREEKWDRVLARLSPLPEAGGRYRNADSAPDTFAHPAERRDHPTLLAPFGMLPGAGADRDRMRATLEAVMRSWDWQSTWGWDYALIAMTAARVGRPDLAVEALMMDAPKNRYLPSGHNYQDDRLPLYLPGNGGLLTAVAMMAAGWDGAPERNAPGFPEEGWTVRHEGLHPLP